MSVGCTKPEGRDPTADAVHRAARTRAPNVSSRRRHLADRLALAKGSVTNWAPLAPGWSQCHALDEAEVFQRRCISSLWWDALHG